MKEESELKSQQIEACNANISRLNKEVEALSHSLQEKQATVSQLERKLQSHKQAAITPEQLLELLKLAPQTAELEHRLQEAEYQKQKAELEREMAIKEMEAHKKFQMQLHAKLGTCKLFFEHRHSAVCSCSLHMMTSCLNIGSMCHILFLYATLLSP